MTKQEIQDSARQLFGDDADRVLAFVDKAADWKLLQMRAQTEKLVRDRIPNRIRATGEPCVLDQHYRKAHPEEMRDLLVAKLREEIAEFEAKPSGEELVDIFEAFVALALTESLDLRIIQHDAEQKRYERGAFEQRFVLFLPEKTK